MQILGKNSIIDVDKRKIYAGSGLQAGIIYQLELRIRINMIDLDIMIEAIRNNHLFIQMHNFPDPDAIASADGLKFCRLRNEDIMRLRNVSNLYIFINAILNYISFIK